MIQWLEQPKHPQIAKFVECYWLIEKGRDANTFAFPKLNPDPCAHLIISPSQQAYRYETVGKTESGLGGHMLYPHLSTLQLDHRQPFVHLGIKFKVGALYSIKACEQVGPIVDRVVPFKLHSLLNDNQPDLSFILDTARTDGSGCRNLLDQLLVSRLASIKRDKYAELTAKAVAILDQSKVSEIGTALHCSQRTVERAFVKVTGFTLKQCQQMNRLEAMLEYLSSTTDNIDWADIAYRFGFSDQPHLIRYLKAQLGLTPEAYANSRGLTIDAYGGLSG